MAAITGVGGNVTYVGGYVTNVDRWTLNYEGDIHEVTDFTTVGPKAFIPGLTSWSGSYECNWDDTVNIVGPPGPGGVPALITLQLAAGQQLTGDALVQRVSSTVEVGGVARVTYEFQGTGLLNIV